MKQGRHLLIAILWIQVFAASGQSVEFLKGPFSNEKKLGLKSPFHFIEEKLDTAELDYIGRVRVTPGSVASLRSMYLALEKQAKKNGANAFRLISFDRPGTAIIADLYFLSDDTVARNNMLKAHNTVYVFGGDLYGPETHDAFEFNGQVRNIRNGTFFKYKLREGEKVKLTKGTITGTVMWISWKPNQLPAYYSVRDFGEKAVVKRTEVSQAAKPSKFIELDRALGALLVAVLDATSD
ncbi:MAG: hypothetical protein DIU61_002500 [Bacteroidota bacterium]|jgi:hypothetical protein|nr:MAG: hypothetical protein DIU61_07255 [Bacteroidota bacterium]